MKAVEGFSQVRVTIESQEELDVMLEALRVYAEKYSEPCDGKNEVPERLLEIAKKADMMRMQIAEAAGL